MSLDKSFILIFRMPPSGDMEAFRSLVKKANRVVILTGAGVSAESGVPTFRGQGDLVPSFVFS